VLALVAQRVQEFTVSREQTGAVGFDLRPFLAEAELHREPVDGRQLLDLLVRGAEGCQTDLLRELGEARIGQERHVAQEFVNAVSAKERVNLNVNR